MAINLKGRSFLTLADFTPAEIRYLLDLGHDLKAKRRAGVCAPPAARAQRFVCPEVLADRPARADGAAFPAADAAVFKPGRLRFCAPRLRIVAPGAPQAAALEEKHRADARPVYEGAALYVKNSRVMHGDAPFA